MPNLIPGLTGSNVIFLSRNSVSDGVRGCMNGLLVLHSDCVTGSLYYEENADNHQSKRSVGIERSRIWYCMKQFRSVNTMPSEALSSGLA
jgi:hypothetical protein